MLLKFLPVSVVVLLLCGCVSVEPLELRDTRYNLKWPSPPNPPRIEFLRIISNARDIVPTKGKVESFLTMITGDQSVAVDFSTPYGIAGDNENILYITDSSAGIVHRYDFAEREVSFISAAGETPLVTPVGCAVDHDGNLYVSDSGSAKVLKFGKNSEFLKELKGEHDFQRPAGIAVSPSGEKYVVDVLARKLYVFGHDDRFLGSFPPETVDSQLAAPSNVAVDREGNVYVTDTMNFVIRSYDRNGTPLNTIGEIGDAPGSFARPKGVALDSQQHVYVVDASHDNFQIFDRDGTLLLFVGKNGNGPGEFYLPSGIFIDDKDRIFVADTYNHRIQLFQYLKEGGK